jgi:hypothetical protein
MHNNEFGQACYQDLIKRILQKFSLHFSEFDMIYYEFSKFKQFLEFKSKRISVNWKSNEQYQTGIWPTRAWPVRWRGRRWPTGGREAVKSLGGAPTARGGGPSKAREAGHHRVSGLMVGW